MEESAQPLSEHLEELRSRVVKSLIGVAVAFALCFQFADVMIAALVGPLEALESRGVQLVGSVVTEAFFTKLWVAFIASIFVSSPVILYQIWQFVAPGLYAHERRYVWPFVGFGSVFFLGGGAFCYHIVLPVAFDFFVGEFEELSLAPLIKLSDHISLTSRLLLAFGLVFELPVFTFFFTRVGLVTHTQLLNYWRYAVVAVFIVSAILTPPDAVSQMLMAGPLLILCTVSVGVAYVFAPTPSDPDEEGEGE